MSRTVRIVMTLGLTCWLIASDVLFADQTFAVVGRSAGQLAVLEPDQPWRVVPAGGLLPQQADCRTSADGSGQIVIAPDDALFLGPLAIVKYDLKARRVQLLSGRLFCTAPAGKAWTVVADTATVEITDAGIETGWKSEHEFQITALRGNAKVLIPNFEPATLLEKTTRSWVGLQPSGDAIPLPSNEQARLAAWTTPLPPGQGPGQLVITDPQSGSRTRLSIARYHAELVVTPPMALVKLDQAFYNPFKRQQEGEFVFNLPPGASVCRFAMYVTPTTLIEGEVIDRQKADSIYTTIVNQRRDPAILEKIGDSLFRMRVFPIFGEDIKRILLDYTLPLNGESGQYHVQLPLLSDLEPIWDLRVHGTIHGPTPLQTVSSPTHPEIAFQQNGNDRIGFDFTQRNYLPASDLMLSFQQKLPQKPATFRQLVAAPLRLPLGKMELPETQFVTLNAKNELVRTRDTWDENPATYFLAEIPTHADPAATAPADVLILLETASTIPSLDKTRSALKTVLAGLRPQDRVRMVCFDMERRPLHAGWLQPGAAGLAQAWNQFEQQFCLGGCDLLAAFRSAADEFKTRPPVEGQAEAARRKLIICLGSGIDTVDRPQPAAGPNDPPPPDRMMALVDHCQRELDRAGADFWAIDILTSPVTSTNSERIRRGGGGFFQIPPRGYKLGTERSEIDRLELLKMLTERGGGRYFDVADRPADRGNLFQWILAGFPSTIRVGPVSVEATTTAGVSQATDVYFNQNILPGESIRVTGRMSAADKIKLTYSIHASAKPAATQTLELTPADPKADHPVGRYWAEQRLAHFNRIDVTKGDALTPGRAREAIVRLSREWSLLTPQTAFLVLETEQEYVTWNVPRSARRPYWSADGVPPITPLAANWLVQTAPARVLEDRKPKTLPAQFNNRFPIVNNRENPATAKSLIEAGQLALRQERFDAVSRSLAALRLIHADQTAEYAALKQKYESAVTQQGALDDFGLRGQWFNLTAPNAAPQFGLQRILSNSPPISAEYRRLHPLAEALLKDADLPGGQMTLQEFANWLEGCLGVDVQLDSVKLEEDSIATDTRFKVPYLKRMSIAAILRHVPLIKNLDLHEEADRLVITTSDMRYRSDNTRFFPVATLLDPTPQFAIDDLRAPLQDRDLAVAKRIEEKLRKKVKFHLEEATLEDVVNRVQEEINDNVVLDEVKLEEETIAVDTADVNCKFDSVPLGDALKWVLEAKNLQYQVKHQAIEITTKAEGYSRNELKFYPADGLIYRNPVNLQARNKIVADWVQKSRERNARFDRFIGMGGFGGGMGGGMGGGVLPATAAPQVNTLALNEQPIGISDVAVDSNPAEADNRDLVVNQTETKPEPSISQEDLDANLLTDPAFELAATTPSRLGSNVEETMLKIMRLTGGELVGSPWKRISLEGGEIAFYYPSFCFIVRNDTTAHREIGSFLLDLREQTNREGADPRIQAMQPAQIVTENDRAADADALVKLVQQMTGEGWNGPNHPWETYSSDNGADVIYDPVRSGLHVRHANFVLDEVQNLLLQLRRERYFALHKSKPWEQLLSDGNNPLSLLPTHWKPTAAEPHQPMPLAGSGAAEATLEELQLLKVRKEMVAGTWTDNVDPTKGAPTAFYLATTNSGRLNLKWPDREIRLNGADAALLDFGLQVQEIGPWGHHVREWLDVELPHWPHRSNQELAELFEVSVAPLAGGKPQPTGTQTLRFIPTSLKSYPNWIDITFDVNSGLPIDWAATSRNKLTRRYRFATEPTADIPGVPQTFVCTPASGTAKRWTIASGPDALPEIPLPDAPAKDLLRLAPQRPAADQEPGLAGFELLRTGKNAEAALQFKTLLKSHPDQPLILFLLGWSLDHQTPPATEAEIQQAYGDAVRVGPRQFVDYLALQHPLSTSRDVLYHILNQQPKATRTLEDELNLLNRAVVNQHPDLAIEHGLAAWNMQPKSEASQFEIIKLLVKIHLDNKNVPEALKWVTIWRDREGKVPGAQLTYLLDMLDGYGQTQVTTPIYLKLIERPDFPKLTIEQQQDLLFRFYRTLSQFGDEKLTRWKMMLWRCELVAPNTVDATGSTTQLITELHDTKEKGSLELIPQLIAAAKFPLHQQQLRGYLAGQNADVVAAANEYWKLYTEGYSLKEEIPIAILRFDQAGMPEKAVTVAEAHLRAGHTLTKKSIERLADVYEKLNRPDAARRIRTAPYD